ncbi:hypothetical protein [Pediococcus claussenii]|nr:hypothetical protein [Pediococcus claussenii]ANZ69443.1 hypothetical protein AYR57_03580 [Pediococcus claussenii]ANZ71263.1 hypothetical protein AYR58_03595 [Pediococcus claussenii]
MHKLSLTPEQLSKIVSFTGQSLKFKTRVNNFFPTGALAFGPKKPRFTRLDKFRARLGFGSPPVSIVYFDDFSVQILNKNLETVVTMWPQQIKYIQIGLFKLRVPSHVSPYQYVISIVSSDKIYRLTVNYLDMLHQLSSYCERNRIILEDPFNTLHYTDHYKLFEYYNTKNNYAEVAIKNGYMPENDAKQ